MATDMDGRRPTRIFGVRVNRAGFVALLATLLLVVGGARASAQMESDSEDERSFGLHDSEFKILIACTEDRGVEWRALHCPFPLQNYQLITRVGALQLLEQGRVSAAGLFWSLYKAGATGVFWLMWVAITMPWMDWFINAADRISVKFLTLLSDFNPGNILGLDNYDPTAVPSDPDAAIERVELRGWWLFLLILILVIGAWKMVRPLKIEKHGAPADTGGDLVSGLKFIAGGGLVLVFILVGANWHGPNPYSHRGPPPECSGHLRDVKKSQAQGCVSGFTRLALLPVGVLRELGVFLDSAGSALYETFFTEGSSPGIIERELRDAQANPGVWRPYITDPNLWAYGGGAHQTALQAIFDGKGNVVSLPPIGSPAIVAAADCRNPRFSNSSNPADDEWECDRPVEHDSYTCRIKKVNPRTHWKESKYMCSLNQAAVQEALDERVAYFHAAHRVPALTPCLEPLQSSWSYHGDGVAGVDPTPPSRIGTENEYLACRVLQPWKKQFIHDMWETMHFGFSPDPTRYDLTNIAQTGSSRAISASAYPSSGLNNGTTVSLLLWALAPASGATHNSELLHNLQIEEAYTLPSENGRYDTGAVITGGIAVIGGWLAGLAMLALMIYASGHMLVVIMGFPLAVGFAPFPRLRRVTVRLALSLVRSAILVTGMIAFVYSMAIYQQALFEITAEIPWILSAFFLVGAQIGLLYIPYKLFTWSKKTNTKLKARLRSESTWKQLQQGGMAGVRQFGKDVGQDIRTAGKETFGSGRSLTADQGGRLRRQGAPGATTVSTTPKGKATAGPGGGGKLERVTGAISKKGEEDDVAARQLASIRAGKAAAAAALVGLGGTPIKRDADAEDGATDTSTPAPVPTGRDDPEPAAPAAAGVLEGEVPVKEEPATRKSGGESDVSEAEAPDQDDHVEDIEGKGGVPDGDPFGRGAEKKRRGFVKGAVMEGGAAALRKLGETEPGRSIRGVGEGASKIKKKVYDVPKAFVGAYREGGWEALKPVRELVDEHDRKAMRSLLSDGDTDIRHIKGVLGHQQRNREAERIRNELIDKTLEDDAAALSADHRTLGEDLKSRSKEKAQLQRELRPVTTQLNNAEALELKGGTIRDLARRQEGLEAKMFEKDQEIDGVKSEQKSRKDSHNRRKRLLEGRKADQIWERGDQPYDPQVVGAAAKRLLLTSPDNLDKTGLHELLRDDSARRSLGQASRTLRGAQRELSIELGWKQLLEQGNDQPGR